MLNVFRQLRLKHQQSIMISFLKKVLFQENVLTLKKISVFWVAALCTAIGTSNPTVLRRVRLQCQLNKIFPVTLC